ncbi:LytR/AlgR family response regulator transcription factor [Sporomusa malonica]|uniref:Two component transcriptional regulator, LytTR family n=1 Tax=Sporomusa malonica TaxID=112901 RepID=A0A1W2BBA1_9FIRM|nr:LytTR family DNA-binding domain-containing protein [Sporomusa malonica]SMC69982.1 two component transcriptional regulator, LytTR family [Sporomusa malonica]
MKMKAIVVDDEALICDEIEYLLKKEADIDVVAKFSNAFDALAHISQTTCDLVFLDIKMPGISGLELAQKLTQLHRPPLLVFITAFPEHALEAFGTSAVGYITKPITQSSLAKVLEKIRSIVQRTILPEKPCTAKICILRNGKIIPLDKQEIVFIYVQNKDVFIRTKDGEYVATLAMQEIEKILAEPNFYRVHRQYLVNLNKVLEIIPWFHGSYQLRMDDFKAEEVPVSRNKVKELKTLMGLR